MLTADVDSHLSVAWGIVVGLIASCIQSLGLTMQRKSHVLNEQLPEHKQRVEYKRPLWLLGFAVFISSNVLGSLFQIASLPVVILAPLGAVSLLWNAFFARFLLGDVFSLWMVFGTVFIAGGAVLIAVFGIVPEPTHSLDDLLALFGRAAFVAYFSLLGAAVFVCLVITHVTEFSLNRLAPSPSPSMTPSELPEPVASLTQAMAPPPAHVVAATENTPLLDRKSPGTPTPGISNSRNARTKLALAISYASASGILSGMCLLFAKSGVELLILTIGGNNQFWRWQAWMLVLGLVVFALLQLWYLQKSLIFADPTIACPLAFCFYNLSSIVNGLVYFDQFALLSALKLSLISVGMVVLLGGVWVVSIHAGSGRVDVGTWQEGDDDLEDEWEDVEVAPESRERETGPSGFFAPRLEATLSDSAAYRGRLLSSPSTIHQSTFPTSPGSEFESEYMTQSFILPTSPPSGGRSKARRRHRYSILQPTEPSLPGGGLSIGLSPVSPGFAIVPKRRISGMRRVVQRAIMRRTVSDSDIAAGVSQSPTRVARATTHAPDNGSVEEDPAVTEEHQNKVEHIRAMARWQWLRGVFRDRDV